MNITGGTPGLFMFANNTATMNILGGDMGMVFYNDSSMGNSSMGTISGGTGWDTLDVQTSGVISMIGSGFTLDGSPASGNLLSGTFGNLVGTLQNGDTIDVTLGINSGTVALVVPEPTTASLAMFMGLFYFVRQRSSETRR